MRRHRKAPSAGPTTSARAKGAFGRLSIAIFGALLAAMLLGASAQAAAPTYLGSFDDSALPVAATGSGDTAALSAGSVSSIATKQGEIATKQQAIIAKNGEISQKQTELGTAVEPQKKVLEEEIEDLEADVQTLQADIQTLEAEIVSLEEPAKTITNVVTSTGAFAVGQHILGAGIPAKTTITAIGAGTLSISKLATATASGVSLSALPAFKPGRLAVNEETGDVYVIDGANDAIRVFDSEGHYESTIEGSSITPGAETLGIGAESDIAIDNSGGANKGRIYVNSESAGAVFAFNPNGSFAWEKSGFSELCGIAVDAAGNPWSSEYGLGVQKLSPTDGTPADGNHVAAFGASCEIAFDSAANLYVRDWGVSAINKFTSSAYDLPGTTLRYPSGGGVFLPLQGISDVDVNRKSDDPYLAHGTDVTVYDAAQTQVPLEAFESSVAGHAYLGVTVNTKANTIYVSDTGNSDVEIWGPPSYPLNTTTSGTGLGSVKCDGGPCDPEYLEGTEVTLEAVPAAHSTFTGWAVAGGDPSTCTGTTNPCTITVGEEVFADAAFAPVTHTVTVAVTGKGSVSANSGAIANCTASGGTCTGPYAEANAVLLTATPSAHQKFTGWSGCDAEPVGTGKCQVNVDANESVTATFAPITHKLTIAKAGSGAGSITCNGGACAPEYEEGTTISIAASAAAGSSFAGFAGSGCSASPCNLTLGADTTVTGTFNANPPPTCATNPALCPVIKPEEKKPPPVKCKKGFKKKTVKGKSKCVKVKKKKAKGKGKH